MHAAPDYTPNAHQELAELLSAVTAYAEDRVRMEPPLDGPRTQEDLDAALGATITPDGVGGAEAMRIFTDELAPACLSIDHPRYLSFIPCAPSDASIVFDLVVGASSIYAGSWLEGAGAVWAENQALRWVADLVGMPEGAGGVFVPGGTIGNLSALVAARGAARHRDSAGGPAVAGRRDRRRPQLDRVRVRGDGRRARRGARGRPLAALGAGRCARRSRRTGRRRSSPSWRPPARRTSGSSTTSRRSPRCAASTGSGSTSTARTAERASRPPRCATSTTGVEHCDSFIVDPHKWLFAPFDCCALLYREPALARAAHTQRAGYLDVLTDTPEWNPTDYSVGLTRRARGLPFWFSLVVNGTDAYTAAIERTLDVARFAEAEVLRRPELELVRERDLSVVVFRRLGWSPEDYRAWSEALLADGLAFVVPTTHDGETLARFAIVNPATTEADIAAVLDTMA